MTTCTIASRAARTLPLFWLFVLIPATLFAQTLSPVVAYVSTYSGGSIVAVHANGTQTTVATNLSFPEGITLGPDGLIYVCEPDDHTILRINPLNGVSQTVYSGEEEGLTPEGPSFSPSGDLYFNTKDHVAVYKISSSVLAALPDGGATPASVENSDGISFGEGTAFDINHNLLIVDRSGSAVLRFLLSSSTFDDAHKIVGINMPIGVAVSSGGDIFVANNGTNSISRFANDGSSKGTYLTFAASDLPFFLKFDSNDTLYVVTADSNGNNANLWSIPPASTTATLPAAPLVSFGAGSAVGVAVVETGVSEIQPLSPTQPTHFFNGFPFQFDADYSQAVSTYGISVNGIDMIVDAQQITKNDWAARSMSAGSTFGAAGSECIQHTGAGTNCVCYVAKCFPHGGDPTTATGAQCPTSPASDLLFTDTFTTCDTMPTLSNASFFTADDDPMVNDFRDILIPGGVSGSFSPPAGSCGTEDPITGGTRGTNSIFCVAENAPITITISSPTGTNYTLGQQVQATYQCTPSTASCTGTAPSGNNIDTSTVGSHDFTVTGTTGTNTATKTVTYTVGFGTSGACLLYDPTKMVKSGAVLPLKLYLCDAAGHDVSSSTTVLHAISVKLISSGTTDTALLSPGSAQPDNNFRYDSTLGPSGGYIFNFDTSGKHGTYNMFFTATGDPNVHTLTFQVK